MANVARWVVSIFCLTVIFAGVTSAQDSPNGRTAIQIAIDKQKERLNSSEVEDRRDALMRLGGMRRAEASRVAQSALSDPAPIVRATAVGSVGSLPAEEAAGALLPLLSDLDEFVRQQTAYALGFTKSRRAVAPLLERLNVDKMDSVRAAAVVALGQIGDEAAVVPLVEVLSSTTDSKGKKKRESNEFILRAAARSLGEIRSRAAVPALIDLLGNEKMPIDVRREAATSLGLIGDSSAGSALQAAAENEDVYLARASQEALRRLRKS
ncbi:MAG TPA: HEAT repeat domain-containing protein [Pyrinomonadaceae bacterium]|nr:HEAT repeat domain-containing protein [Pyrinomonadaceae bacterium]